MAIIEFVLARASPEIFNNTDLKFTVIYIPLIFHLSTTFLIKCANCIILKLMLQ